MRCKVLLTRRRLRFFVNRELPQPYLRYLERCIREKFKFGSTPIKIRVRKRAD
ncbi:MAG: hypothetical protein AAB327_09455 [Actinomycetota bacterium]